MTRFLGASEWLFGALTVAGFWSKEGRSTWRPRWNRVVRLNHNHIIPFMPDGWNASAGGFSATQENVAFLMKDFVLIAVSIYLLKQDLPRLLIGKLQRSSVSGSHEFFSPVLFSCRGLDPNRKKQ